MHLGSNWKLRRWSLALVGMGTALGWIATAEVNASPMNMVIATRFVAPTDNPFLADPANVPDQNSESLDGTVPSYIDIDPDCPVLMFKAHGAVANDPSVTIAWGPDGAYTEANSINGPQGGISDYNVPFNSLIGVFVGDPPLGSPPPALPYDVTSLNFAPALGQVFFIGDGITGFNINQGDCQMWTVPDGAKRLYFAVADSNGWANNYGSIDFNGITVDVHCMVPEPSTLVLGGLGVLGLVGFGYRRRPAALRG